MRRIKFLSLTLILILLMASTACSDKSVITDEPIPKDEIAADQTVTADELVSPDEPVSSDEPISADELVGADEPIHVSQSTGKIFLYGEQHGVEKIIEKEFELWYEYYTNENMRHLFIESPYYTEEFLNIWMQLDNDDILDELYEDWRGTSAHNPYLKEFYKKIKSQCPETIFHGTDVGHQYSTTGKRFLKYLEENGLEGSEQYLLTQEAIEQGILYYRHSDHAYRENKMAENFIREFDKLNGESVMGIYGSAHTYFNSMDPYTQSVPCMANQLKKIYNDNIDSEDLSFLAKDIEPIRVDEMVINDKKYEASYFGKQDLNGFKDYSYREYWRLEDAFDDFKDMYITDEVLPYTNYPMLIESGQIFVIDYMKVDGSSERRYYRSDGFVWNYLPSTRGFELE